MIVDCETPYFSIKFATWCCNSNFPSRLTSSRISDFEVVAARLPYPILLSKFLGNVVDSRSINWRCSSLLLAINAFAVALATTVFTTSLFFLNFSKNCFTFLPSAAPNISVLPCFKRDILLAIAFSFLVISLYQTLSFRAIYNLIDI